MNELSSCIETLFHLHHQIKITVVTLERTNDNNIRIDGNFSFNEHFFDSKSTYSDCLVSISSNLSIIMFSSFMDEYNYLNPVNFQPEFKERILKLKKKNSPGKKRINKWKDIKRFRNDLLAHNFKINGKSFFSDDIKKLQYKIPRTTSEKKLFLHIIEKMCMNVADEFPEIIQKLNLNNKMTDKLVLIGEDINFEKEVSEIYKLME